MKHLRVTADVDREIAPSFFTALAGSAAIDEVRVVDWSMAAEESVTLLYEIDGTPEPLSTVRESSAVESVEVSATDRPPFYAMVTVRADATAMSSAISCALERRGLLVRKPLVYRDMTIHASAVGDPGPLQDAMEHLPPSYDLTVEEIGTYRGGPGPSGATLSDRQREVVAAALEAGYYDRPRGTTHEELAERLDCAPATVSEHLQKAEAALVKAAMAAPPSRV